MDDLSGAISGLLSQPGAMEQLSQMAKQLGLQPGGNPAPEKQAENLSQPNLLQALRPLMKPEKQQKLDRAARALRLMQAAKAAGGLLGTGRDDGV